MIGDGTFLKEKVILNESADLASTAFAGQNNKWHFGIRQKV